MKFDYYIFTPYVPELDGDGPTLYSKWIEQVDLCEELGFSCVWITEHHFHHFGGMLPNPQILMATLAERTKRIRLGTAVTLLPLHNPLRIAEDMAMLDILSKGRIDVGVGRGMEWLNFQAFGSEWATAQERVEEGIEILKDAWTKENCTWQGRFFQNEKPITVLPRPVQQPHPPIWMTANRDPAHFRWIGKHGLNLMTIPWVLPSLDISREFIAEYRAGLRDARHNPDDFEVLGLFPVYVAETSERALREMGPHWRNMRRIATEARGGTALEPEFETLVAANRALFGDPDSCRRQLDRIRDLGLTRIALHTHVGGLPQDRVLESLRLFMTEVAPVLAAA